MTTAHYTGTVSGTKPATGIGASAQGIEMTVTPNFAGTVGAAAANPTIQSLVDFSETSRNQQVIWRGDQDPGYFALRVGAVEVCRFYSLHTAGQTLRIRAEFGGSGFAYLVVNGCAARKYAVMPTLPVVDPALTSIAFGSDKSGTQVFDGTIEDVIVCDYRPSPHVKIAVMGDSITQEPSIMADNVIRRSWSRPIATGIGHDRGVVWNAGVNSDYIESLTARFDTDVGLEAPHIVVVQAGINCVVNDHTLPHCEAALDALLAKIHGIGAMAVWFTCLPFGASVYVTGPRETVRQGINTYAIATWDAYWDASAYMGKPTTNPLALWNEGIDHDWAYFDFLHLNQNGLDAQGAQAWTAFLSGIVDATDQSITSAAAYSQALTSSATFAQAVTL